MREITYFLNDLRGGAAASSAAYLLYLTVSFGRWLLRRPVP